MSDPNVALTMVKRYMTRGTVYKSDLVAQCCHHSMEESAIGEYVKYTDYAALTTQLADKERLLADRMVEIANLEASRADYVRMEHEAQEKLAAVQAKNEHLMRRIGSVEMKEHLQTIDERDAAEEALSQAYFLIKGESPEWSNLFHYSQALEDIDDAQRCLQAEIKQLESNLAAALRLIRNEYLPWVDAGGATNCEHGIADGISCRKCDKELLASRAKEEK
jgi:hypothetical protein